MTTAQDLLRDAGLRRTEARIRVLGLVRDLGHPLTHAELTAREELADLDAITLYRTLATLEDAGLVHRVLGVDGAWRTCAQPEGSGGCPGNHAHFQCTGCGRMRCLVNQPMPRVVPPQGATIQSRHFVAVGRCAACAALADAAPLDVAPLEVKDRP